MKMAIRLDVRPLLGPVRDQGPRPTCLAHATTTAHEHARQSTVALSPEYLHYFASNNGNSPEGVDFPDVSRALLDPGQPTETECPYHPNEHPGSWTPPTDVTLYRRYSVAPERGPDEVAALLESGHAPVLGIATTDAFYVPSPPWVLSPGGPVRGLHAVVAVGVGITQTARRFLIRNSWGTAWADAGHAWLDDDFIVQHLRDLLVLTEEVT
ncbi:MAG: C1 family peptidase [Acidobacteria bacterium]|nr:C1 family peptidase [Acidobacteriota bacterium]